MPPSPEFELVARAQAILRRTGANLPGERLRFADLLLDEERHELRRGETEIPLTATEFSLLRYFMLNEFAQAHEDPAPSADDCPEGEDGSGGGSGGSSGSSGSDSTDF